MRRSVWATLLAMLLSLLLTQVARAAAVTQTWSVGNEPFGVTVDPRDGRVYVAIGNRLATSSEYMWVIDPSAPPPSPSPFPPPSNILLPGAQVMSVLDVSLDRLFVSTANGLAMIDMSTRAVTTLPIGTSVGLTLDPATHRVYVATISGVVVVDGATGTVLPPRYPDPAPPSSSDAFWSVAQDPSRHLLFVANGNINSPSLVVLDDGDLSVVGGVALPAIPRFALTVDAPNGLVYVGGFSSGTSPAGSVYAIDAARRQITKTLDVGAGVGSSFSMTLAPATNTLFVSVIAPPYLNQGNALVVVDTPTFTTRERIPLSFQPGQSALHPDGRLYVSEFNAARLAAITLTNVSPVIDGVTFSPSAPRTTDVVHALVAAHDPEGQTVTLSYQWLRNGMYLAGENGPSLDLGVQGNGDRGDTITVRVTASDGVNVTGPVTASVVVADSAPVTESLTLLPTAPGTNDVLTAVAVTSDPDRDMFITWTFRWKVNGAVRAETSGTNSASTFDLSTPGDGDRGDVVTVDVIASDGLLSSSVVSASATVVNSAPTLSVSLSDPTPRKRDLLLATATAADADGDALAYAYTWRVNGKVKQTNASSTGTSSLDLRSVEAEIGDVITVEVVVSDRRATATASATAIVAPTGR